MHGHKINISELRVIMNYIGIDLGTSAVKLLLMEGSGKILKIVSREYPICFPKPGWSEQNPYDWFTVNGWTGRNCWMVQTEVW